MASSTLSRGLLIAALTLLGSASAEAAATDWSGDARAQVRLITATDQVDGGPLQAGLEFHYAPDWHGYWRTPGDAGIAPTVDWAGARNVKSTSIAWPAPTRLAASGFQNSVYEGDVILPVTVDVIDARSTTGLTAAVDFAACANICVPIHVDLSLTIPAGAPRPSAQAGLLAAAWARVPGSPASAGIEVLRSAIEPAGTATRLVVELRSKTEPFKTPDLFIEGAGDGLPAAPTAALADGGSRATLTALMQGTAFDTPLTITVVDGARSAEFTSSPKAPQSPAVIETGWLAILASALVGGLILNLMPCVLPVLSIKLLGLARHARAERRAARLGFVATAVGIVTCFMGLAAILAGLKLSGATIGWGIQFQQPWFLAGMAVLTVLFAASFFEWLPIALPQIFVRLSGGNSRIALFEAFLAGVFSTLLATPCSAPFVGTAIGFALAQGPKEIFAVFLCLGLGMAAPFIGAALFPGIVGFLPRPGAWMFRLRQVLGVLLLGTAAWLLAVLESVSGGAVADAVALPLALLLALRFWTTRGRPPERAWPRAVTAALAGLAVGAAFLPASGGARVLQGREGWQAFNESALDHAVAEGRTVLVDVTASWCLTCKVNEVTALASDSVQTRLSKPGTVRMRADWSRPDPAISAYLKRFARFGIPLDVVYGPNRPRGEALPELLSAAVVVEALDRASSQSAAGG